MFLAVSVSVLSLLPWDMRGPYDIPGECCCMALSRQRALAGPAVIQYILQGPNFSYAGIGANKSVFTLKNHPSKTRA